MTTMEQCAAALHTLAERMAAASQGSDTSGFSRAVSCQIPDISGGFTARLENGTLHNIAEGDDPDAAITLTVNSEDLIALTNGELAFTTAWATDRLKIDASFMDLMKLRSML